MRRSDVWLAGFVGVVLVAVAPALVFARSSNGSSPYLNAFSHISVLSTTIPPPIGDLNPYGVAVVPRTVGSLTQGNVLVSNFNASSNLQGTGTTIMQIAPNGTFHRFAHITGALPGACPGGVGLTTALVVLRQGWVIVGSLPSQDGTTATKGQGCLVILDGQGAVAGTITGPNINGPWGNMATIDNGSGATLFISNTGFGVEAPGQDVVTQANVVRIELSITDG